MSAGGHGGSPKSWVAVSVIFIGFLVGGLGLPLQIWPLFWAGVGIAVVGGILAAAVGIMEDVVLDEPVR
ncbi:hypothetical protein GCM10027589_38270 [Actinocorallia lasiicapitis]